MPVLTVHAGRSAAGQRAAASHTASIASPLVSREALFEQAGIIATQSFGELVEATALLATQPPPAGRTVAIVSNVGGAGVLAADACTDLGLAVHHPGGQTRRRLPPSSPLVAPSTARWTRPRPSRPTSSARYSRRSAPTRQCTRSSRWCCATGATGDLLAAIAEADINVPLAVVVLNQPEAVRLVDAKGGKVPAYAYPETAVRALSRAVKYAEWRDAPRQTVPAFPDVDAERAREIVSAFLARQPAGGWLPEHDVIALLQAVPDTAGVHHGHAHRGRRGDRGGAGRATRWRSRPRYPA